MIERAWQRRQYSLVAVAPLREATRAIVWEPWHSAHESFGLSVTTPACCALAFSFAAGWHVKQAFEAAARYCSTLATGLPSGCESRLMAGWHPWHASPRWTEAESSAAVTA